MATITSPSETASSTAWPTRMPVAIFGAVLGVGGLGSAWRVAAPLFGMPAIIGNALLMLGAALFAILVVLYLAKLARAPQAVLAEVLHPGQSSFFGTLTISFNLMAAAALPSSHEAAAVLWTIGTALQAALVVTVYGNWITRPMSLDHVHPAWFVLMVGIVVGVPVGVALGHVEISWASFTLGCLSAAVLYPIILYRLFFHEPLPPLMRPTLFVLVAPPALLFIAYFHLTGRQLDGFARVLFFAGVFFTVLVLSRPRHYFGIPFAVSWWAYTFPLDAISVAALDYHQAMGAYASAVLALAILVLTSAIVAIVSMRTVGAIGRKALF